MRRDYEIQECDVLVIGGGMAGLSSAIRAAVFSKNVILVDKAKISRSGGSVFSHGYGAPAPAGEFETRLKELVIRSAYLGDQSWFEILLREIGDRFQDMEKWGVHFERDAAGNLKSDAIRGQSKGFIILAHGRQLIESLAQEALRRGVKFAERIAITDLLTSDGNLPTAGHVCGAVGLRTRTGQFVMFKAKAVIIATGLLGAKLHCFTIDNLTGDGYAMAFRAGAEITGLEFAAQSFGIWNRKFATSGPGQFQHGGAKLVNKSGEEFLYKYAGASRSFVGFEGHFDQGAICRAIAVENLEGRGPCYFDCRSWSAEKINNMRKVLPLTMKAFDEPGVGSDLTKELVEVTPIPGMYGTSGQTGIRINTRAQTTLGGLFAVGVAAYYGGGPSAQSLGAVSGHRAGETAAKWAREVDYSDKIFAQAEKLREALFLPANRTEGPNPDQIFYSLNKVVTDWGASLFKTEKRINKVLAEIRRIATEEASRIKASDNHELVKAYEAKNVALMLELYNVAALARKESRMVHYREDFPYTDDQDWLKWVLLKNTGYPGVQVKVEPVPLGCSSILPAELNRKPVPVAYKIAEGRNL